MVCCGVHVNGVHDSVERGKDGCAPAVPGFIGVSIVFKEGWPSTDWTSSQSDGETIHPEGIAKSVQLPCRMLQTNETNIEDRMQ